jgi:hypothetical protein
MGKLIRAVLRGGESSNGVSLPDHRETGRNSKGDIGNVPEQKDGANNSSYLPKRLTETIFSTLMAQLARALSRVTAFRHERRALPASDPSVCLQQGPIDGIFQQDIDMLVGSLFAWAIEFAGFLLTWY